MTELALLQNVRPNAESVTDILIENGRIAKIAPAISDLPADVTVLDGGGDIALPGLIEAHTHMDKTLYGLSWQPHSDGPAGASRRGGNRLLTRCRAHRRAAPGGERRDRLRAFPRRRRRLSGAPPYTTMVVLRVYAVWYFI